MYPLKIPEKYDPANLNLLSHRFTTVYLGNYIPWDLREWVGSHLAVDIAPLTPKQDVFAPLDGTVLKVWEDGAYGKYIVLKHTQVPDPDNFSKTTTLYSSFEHLSEVWVLLWQKVREWDFIWKTGNTWNSFGEHLHFQIDRENAPFFPYWSYTWEDAKKAWVSFSEGVNLGLWFELAKKYTINPLVYLDQVVQLRQWKMREENILQVDQTLAHKEEVLPSHENENIIPVLHSSEEVVVWGWETILTQQNNSKKEILQKVASSDDDLIVNPFSSTLSDKNQKKKFRDISPSHPNYEYISDLVEKWYITWAEDGLFHGERPITRAEFLKFLLLVSHTPLTSDITERFVDIKVWWQNKYINTALDLGIISNENKSFRPNGDLTKAEWLKMILLKFVWESAVLSAKSYEISDVPESAWFAKYFFYALEHHLIDTTQKKVFPNQALKRMEMIDILKKLT